MRTALITILVLSITLLSSNVKAVNTYPPENAAVLYYKNLDFYPPDGEIMEKILDYAIGDIELDEEIVKHLDKYQHVIKELTIASKISYCNWGINYSQGLETLLAGLGEFKKYTWLLLADSRRLASKGDFHEAINLCITAEKIASHVSGNNLIKSIVGTSISAMSDKCMSYILSELNGDLEKLEQIQTLLFDFESRMERLKEGVRAENQLAKALYDIKSPYRLTYEILNGSLYESLGVKAIIDLKTKDPVEKELIEKVKSQNADFYEKTLKYHIVITYDAAAAFDKPYAQASEILSKKIPDKLNHEAKKKPEAILGKALIPNFSKSYGRAVRSQNSLNALKAALEVYIVKAKTGKLPKKLPAKTPNDLYTGKQMIYEITDEGFILRCQGPDTKKDKERDTYIFKVKK